MTFSTAITTFLSYHQEVCNSIFTFYLYLFHSLLFYLFPNFLLFLQFWNNTWSDQTFTFVFLGFLFFVWSKGAHSRLTWKVSFCLIFPKSLYQQVCVLSFLLLLYNFSTIFLVLFWWHAHWFLLKLEVELVVIYWKHQNVHIFTGQWRWMKSKKQMVDDDRWAAETDWMKSVLPSP